jgi:hypothetical protein
MAFELNTRTASVRTAAKLYPTLSDLLTTSDTHDTGDIVVTMAEGFAYEVAASASHLLTAPGGNHLTALPLFGGDHGRVFSPEQFGAVAAAKLYIDVPNSRWCTDAGLTTAATDYTEELQACVDAADVVVGGNGHYMVSEVQVLSRKVVRDLWLYAAPQSTDVQKSVIYLGRDTTFGRETQSIADADHPVEDVTLENVHIDGGREIQTNLVSADGGRYGIRMRGYHNRIRILNCSAVRCATDGFEIHRGINCLASASDEYRPVRDVAFRDCVFDWNRRHGGSGNGLDNCSVENVSFRNNGKNADGSLTPQTEGTGPTDGANGAISVGDIYGNGVDWETNDTPGGCIRNLTMRGCTLLNNVRDGILLLCGTNNAHAGFLPCQNIHLIECHTDAGDANSNGDYAITITSKLAYKTGPSVFEHVQVLDCTVEGTFTFRSVSGATVTGGRVWGAIPADGFGAFDYATNIVIQPASTNISRVTTPNVSDVLLRQQFEGSFTYTGETITAGSSSAYVLNAPGVTSEDFVELINTGIAGATNTKVSVQHVRGYGTTAAQDDQISVLIVNDDTSDRTTGDGMWHWRVRKAPEIHEYISNADFASGLTASGSLQLAITGLIEGATYRVRFEATGVTGGTATPSIGGTSGTAISATGRYHEDIVAGSGTAEIDFTADGSWSGSIVNVSVNRVQ